MLPVQRFWCLTQNKFCYLAYLALRFANIDPCVESRRTLLARDALRNFDTTVNDARQMFEAFRES